MLADTASGKRPQLKGSRYRDAALFIEGSPDESRAIVVFESGRARLVVIDDPSSPTEFELEAPDTMHAAFSPRPYADRFLTAGRTGRVDVWEMTGGVPGRLVSFNHGAMPVGLASFSSDGRRVISVGADGSFKTWDAGTRGLVVSYGPALVPNR